MLNVPTLEEMVQRDMRALGLDPSLEEDIYQFWNLKLFGKQLTKRTVQ